MSAEMRDFAAAFNKGLDRGVGMYEKGQQQAIEQERNKVLRDQHEAQERHNTRRDDIYAQSVTNAGALSAARAQAALAKASKGTAGGGAPAPAGDLNWLKQGAAEHGLAIPEAPATQPINVNVMGGSGTTETPDPGPVAPPPLAAKGGMIRKYADGGMTVQEALAYGPKAQKDAAAPATAAGAAGSNFSSAYEKSAAAYAKSQADKDAAAKNPTPSITPTGPVGTGAGGSYTTQDVQPGGVLSGNTAIDPVYRRGGTVRRFADGGSTDMSDPQAAVKSMAYTPANKNPDGSLKTSEQQQSGPINSLGQGSSVGSNFLSALASATANANASANGATGSGGDSTGGVSGTGGVGGSASDSAGGSAAAGTSGDAGSDGSGTYRRGGRVRRGAISTRYRAGGAVTPPDRAPREEDYYTDEPEFPDDERFMPPSTRNDSGRHYDNPNITQEPEDTFIRRPQNAEPPKTRTPENYPAMRGGGRVRRFQSGGRVMEAIDTGTSGPGSGYGYRAAPPSRGY